MKQSTKYRLTGTAVGLVYGVAFAFLAAIATGGGHGNFVWIFIYIIPLIGPVIYFPVMGFLAGDLRSFFSKIIYVGLLITHYLVLASLTLFSTGEMAEDNAKMLSRDPTGLITMIVAYLIGQIPLVLLLVRSLLNGSIEKGDDESKNLSITA